MVMADRPLSFRQTVLWCQTRRRGSLLWPPVPYSSLPYAREQQGEALESIARLLGAEMDRLKSAIGSNRTNH
jgi:hypothetical protein